MRNQGVILQFEHCTDHASLLATVHGHLKLARQPPLGTTARMEDFLIEGKIGEGAHGVVLRAKEIATGCTVSSSSHHLRNLVSLQTKMCKFSHKRSMDSVVGMVDVPSIRTIDEAIHTVLTNTHTYAHSLSSLYTHAHTHTHMPAGCTEENHDTAD